MGKPKQQRQQGGPPHGDGNAPPHGRGPNRHRRRCSAEDDGASLPAAAGAACCRGRGRWRRSGPATGPPRARRRSPPPSGSPPRCSSGRAARRALSAAFGGRTGCGRGRTICGSVGVRTRWLPPGPRMIPAARKKYVAAVGSRAPDARFGARHAPRRTTEAPRRVAAPPGRGSPVTECSFRACTKAGRYRPLLSRSWRPAAMRRTIRAACAPSAAATQRQSRTLKATSSCSAVCRRTICGSVGVRTRWLPPGLRMRPAARKKYVAEVGSRASGVRFGARHVPRRTKAALAGSSTCQCGQIPLSICAMRRRMNISLAFAPSLATLEVKKSLR